MNEAEQRLFGELREQGIKLASPSWESCREWLNANEWKINSLSDYPRGEVKFAVRRGFERIEVSGTSDLEVMAKAMLEIHRRASIDSGT